MKVNHADPKGMGWDGSLLGDLAVQVDNTFHLLTRIRGNKE
jgi:hypothetical protein